MQLPQKASLQRTHHAVRSTYRASLEPSLWPDALQAIADALGDVGAILIYGRDDGKFGVVCSPSLQHCVAEYATAWSGRDIRAIRCRERGYFFGRDVVTDRDVITRDEMADDPFYAEFLSKHGLRYFAAAMVSPDPRVEVAISIQRASERQEYTDDELALAGELGAHVETALRLSIRLMDAEIVNCGLSAALDTIGIGVLALDSLRRVTFKNATASSLLGDGIDLVNERLLAGPQVADKIDEEIEKALAERGEAPARPAPIVVARSGTARPLAVYVMPIPFVENPGTHFLGQARIMVLLVNPELDAPPDATIVRDLLGLTLGEARVASLVGEGMSPRDAAQKLGVSVETARTVLKRVFQKVGVSRQSELVALMSRLLLR